MAQIMADAVLDGFGLPPVSGVLVSLHTTSVLINKSKKHLENELLSMVIWHIDMINKYTKELKFNWVYDSFTDMNL